MITQPASSDFFVAGGTLRFDAPSYVERPADATLLHLAATGQLCYVLTTRQMGKSSLMSRTARQLRAQGYRVALIDLTSMGQAEETTWYLSLLDDLVVQLHLPVDAEDWWQAHQSLSHVKRFTKFVQEVVMGLLQEPVAIFIDEVDSALKLPFSDDFFAAVRAIHNQNVTAVGAGQLAFILLGVAAPNDLIKDSLRTPFNVGERLQLGELSLPAAQNVWRKGLPQPSERLVERIFYWTSGHPYLTQKVARAIAQDTQHTWQPGDVDVLVHDLFFSERSLIEESNLQFIQGRVSGSPQRDALLKLYGTILRDKKPIANDERSDLQTELKLYGLVKVNAARHLVVRNRIYAQTFSHRWIRQQRQSRQKQLFWLLALFFVLILGGAGIYFWQQAQQTEALLAASYRDNFLATENPTLRLDNLANLLLLDGYQAEGVALFQELSSEEQVALFRNVTPDLQLQMETAVTVLYQTLTIENIDEIAENSQVLAAMMDALNQVQAQKSTLATEIESWLQGRAAALREDYDGARIAYSVVLSLNPDNLSARYERALAQIALNQTAATLDDLTVLAEQNPSWRSQVQQLLADTPTLQAAVSANNDTLLALLQATPVPTVLATAVPTDSPINTPLSTDAVLPTLTALPSSSPVEAVVVETAVLNEIPLSVPATAPEGFIVYTCFDGAVDQICTIEASGANQQQLTFGSSTAWYASGSLARNEILYSSREPGLFTIFRLALDEQEVQAISSPLAGDYSPTYSPDGRQIAFTRAEAGQQRIWVMNRDGSGLRLLTNLPGDSLDPTWSPDGQMIAFAYQASGETRYAHQLIQADGTNLQALPVPLEQIGGRSDWSPDGQWLAIYAGPPGRHDIYLLAVDGSEYRRLTNSGDNLAPSFSPDGNWIVFTSSRDGDNELFIMRLDGSGLTQLTNNELSDWQPRWVR
ncbi:AAA-like domain-containing protein [Candidatus Leptofilum sp.]|uniref:AAA-like domain-containing protein n=1 Tax=Candidatus Leptofilum sp. TaxID=3241576 RepID=UPI003B5CC1E1